MSLLPSPLFCTTVPKSGTHLIANILRALLGPENVAPNLVSEGDLLSLREGFQPVVYFGHFDYSLDVAARIEGLPLILLGRDPRDVVTSYCSAIFSGKMKAHPLTSYINRHKPSFSTVLANLITGTKVDGAEVPGIRAQFTRYYLRWLPHAAATIRYEEMLPEGQDWSRALAAANRILSLVHVERSPDQVLAALKEGSLPEKSQTFSRGKVGRWAEVFAPAHHDLMQASAPGLLEMLGYAAPAAPSAGKAGPGRRKGKGGGAEAPVALPVAAISAEVKSSLEAVSSKIGRLKNLDDQVHTRVSFVTENESGLGYFCWTDDSLHRAMQQPFSDHRKFDEYVQEIEKRSMAGTPRVVLMPGYHSPVVRAIEPLLAGGRKIHFLDVGCFYGVEDCVVSALLDRHGDAFRITAFDPGWAGRIAPFNFELNRQSDRVTFEPVAVGWHDGAGILYGEYGQCENCRTVNRMVDSETFSFPCRMVRLDSYVQERGLREKLFIKIDIQGGEYQALLGAARTLREQCAGLIVKFIPHALAPMIPPWDFLSLLPARPYRLFMLPFYQSVASDAAESREIRPEDFKAFAVELQQAKVDYCYLQVMFE